GEQHALVRRVPAAVYRGRVLALGVGQLRRRAAAAADPVRRGLLLAGLAPLEIQLLRVGRPAETIRRVADEVGAPHDAVDGQREPAVALRRAVLCEERGAGDEDGGEQERTDRGAHGLLT